MVNDNFGLDETCLACEGAAIQADLKFEGKLWGERIVYYAPGFLCTKCGLQWSTGEQQSVHDKRKREAMEKKYGKPESEDK